MARDRLYPPSVTPGIPKLGPKPKGWIETTFGDVLDVIQRPALINSNREYQLVTAKRNRGGIVPRETLLGKNILTKGQFSVETDDFLISKRQIIHGACGIVPASLNGAIVSGEYSVLRVKGDLLLPYLRYLTHTVYFRQTCFQASVGVDVEKMLFDLNKWLGYKILLPSIYEQHKIVSVLEIWDHAIEAAQRLVTNKLKLKRGLLQSLLSGTQRVRSSCFGAEKIANHPVDAGWTSDKFGKFASLREARWTSGKANQSVSCIELENIEAETGRLQGIGTADLTKSSKTIFREGDVLFGKLRPYLRKHARPSFSGVCSSEIWVLTSSSELCTNEFLYLLVQSEDFVRAANVSSGTKMPRASWEHVAQTQFRLPPLREQHKITEILEVCDREVEGLIHTIGLLQTEKQALIGTVLHGERRLQVTSGR